MSEYQYYEFRAIDRPLTKEEMDELREISTRAEITAHSFVNVYNYADFRGDPVALVERYFDAFAYISNFGIRQLMFRFPGRLLDPEELKPYAVRDAILVRAAAGSTIIDMTINQEEGTGWEEGEGWLEKLLPLREEMASGDLRALYLGWLASAQWGWVDDDVVEPPVPPGLRKLSRALKTLVDFLWLEDDLVAVAAKASAPLREGKGTGEELQTWVLGLPQEEKDRFLSGLLGEEAVQTRRELQRRFDEARSPVEIIRASPGKRTVGELLEAAGIATGE